MQRASSTTKPAQGTSSDTGFTEPDPGDADDTDVVLAGRRSIVPKALLIIVSNTVVALLTK